MNAVGDVLDRHFIRRNLRPEVVPHLAADIAVQFADAVDAVGQANRQHRHRESLLFVGDIFAAQGEESFFIELQRRDNNS